MVAHTDLLRKGIYMTPQEWVAEAKRYLDSYYLFAQRRDPQSTHDGGNQLLDLGIYITMSRELGQCRDFDKERFNTAVRMCYAPNEKPGLLCRHPGETEVQQAHDDYMGVAVGSLYCDENREVAKELGYNHKFYRDNMPDGKIYWGGFFFRFPWVPALLTLCANGRAGLLGRLVMNLYFLSSAFSHRYLKKELSDESGVRLAWVTAMGCKKVGIAKFAIKQYAKQIERKWGGMAKVMQIYHYNDPKHPFVTFFNVAKRMF